MARSWNQYELEAIVEDYFVMLEQEQSGRRFNISAHRRALMGVIDRSNGSIERKHMNISAVMAVLGLPHINGYKPFSHYQNALFEVVEEHLEADSPPMSSPRRPQMMLEASQSVTVGS